MPYIELKKEYLHSSGIVEFVWLIFSFFAVLVAFLRFFKLKIPIHGEDLDKQESSKEISKIPNQQSDIQKASELAQNKNDKDPKEEQKIPDDQLKNENVEIVIDDNDPTKQEQIDQAQKQKQEEEMQTQIKKKNPAQNNNPVEESKDIKKAEPPQPDQQQRDKSMQETSLHIDEWVDKHLISLTIAVLLINSWGCYIYTAFMTILCVILCSVFNRYNILGRMKDGQYKDKRGFGELLFHFWILSLFIAYFVYDQSYSNNYTNYIA